MWYFYQMEGGGEFTLTTCCTRSWYKMQSNGRVFLGKASLLSKGYRQKSSPRALYGPVVVLWIWPFEFGHSVGSIKGSRVTTCFTVRRDKPKHGNFTMSLYGVCDPVHETGLELPYPRTVCWWDFHYFSLYCFEFLLGQDEVYWQVLPMQGVIY